MRKVEYKDDTLTITVSNDDIGIPEVNLTITSTPIVARTRKLKPGARFRTIRTRWTPESDQKLTTIRP